MTQPTLAERIEVLEREVARLSNAQASQKTAPDKDWRSSVGMFAGDPIMKEIIEEGRKVREQDREQTSE